ncbi:hypothetical protein [Niallia circulans]|uniref:hypothetical protein n=1 Tax=Niallia circulans TaxID=1397 RepID=UPI0011405722|nr:hypothetical protein [Niallia circulans]
MLGLSQRSVESFRLVSWDFGEPGQFKQRDSTVFGLVEKAKHNAISLSYFILKLQVKYLYRLS